MISKFIFKSAFFPQHNFCFLNCYPSISNKTNCIWWYAVNLDCLRCLKLYIDATQIKIDVDVCQIELQFYAFNLN